MTNHQAIRERAIEGMTFPAQVGDSPDREAERAAYAREQMLRSMRRAIPPKPHRKVSWLDQAACKGMDIEVFFPPNPTGRRYDYSAALAVCASCPVVQECRDDALATERFGERREGVRGGLPPAERDQLAREIRSTR